MVAVGGAQAPVLHDGSALHAAPDEFLLFCPADHHIPDAAAFARTVKEGLSAAASGAIVTFGVVPTFPSTAYGYIRQGEELAPRLRAAEGSLGPVEGPHAARKLTGAGEDPLELLRAGMFAHDELPARAHEPQGRDAEANAGARGAESFRAAVSPR